LVAAESGQARAGGEDAFAVAGQMVDGLHRKGHGGQTLLMQSHGCGAVACVILVRLLHGVVDQVWGQQGKM